MHIVLGLLGSIVTILILLKKLADAGIDLGGLNPFLRAHRKRWRDKVEGNPLYAIESPMEATALLMTATAKADGDMTAEEKHALLGAFEQHFHLSKRDAAGLLVSSAHLLGSGEELKANLARVMEPSLLKFTADQVESALQLLGAVCDLDPAENELKRELVDQIAEIFKSRASSKDGWT